MPMRLKTPLPDLDGVTEWIHGEPDLANADGQPLLVYIWAISCHICHENMPKLQSWRDRYIPKGLKIVSIHCPRMKGDTDMEKVQTAIDDCGISESCGIDNMHRVKKAFDNEIWPAYFLFDREHKLKRRAAGKTGLSMLEPALEEMLN